MIEPDGFAIVPNVLGAGQADRLGRILAGIAHGEAVRRRRQVYGIRNLFELSGEIRELAFSPEVRALVEPVLGPGAFAVRGTLFDKVRGANWRISWYQDRVIAVMERVEAPGFGPWSCKAGIPHVQPPVEVVEGMLAVRLHLDDCGRDNGALRVLPGTHLHGWIDHEVDAWLGRIPEAVCEAPMGGALLMRPLLLHASSPSRGPRHRRVIHMEFANRRLLGGLRWRHEIA